MDNRYPKNSHLFTIDEDMCSVSTNSPGLVNISSDSGEEFPTEQHNSEPIDLRFRIGGPLNDPMTAFVNEDAARLFAVCEPESREDSVIDITGTDIEREMLSRISEDTELLNISPILFFESSGSNSDELLINANFADPCWLIRLQEPKDRQDKYLNGLILTAISLQLSPKEMDRSDPYVLRPW